MADPARLTIGDQTVELPVLVGSEGETGVDVSKLRAQTGVVTLDYGFASTASCRSGITFLNGEQGVLRYRGYSIEDVAGGASFLEVVWLLLHGDLPGAAELDEFRAEILARRSLDDATRAVIRSLPRNAHPMASLSTAVASLAALPSEHAALSREAVHEATVRLLAQLPMMVAEAHRHAQGLDSIEPRAGAGYSEGLLECAFGAENVDPEVVRTLDMLFVLHADHEQNCSTSTVRFVGSSHANLYSSIAAGVMALWGPLHGGANQKVLEMLEAIQADGGDVDRAVERAKDRSDPFRLMGFGHRVYKNFDPRARLLEAQCGTVLPRLGIEDPLLDIAKRLERCALEDEYFVQRRLYPNVDFYSGILYRALGFPTNTFTTLFSIGRLPGWLAHWREMHEDDRSRIGRPRQIYTGANAREFTPLSDRG